MCDYCAMDAAEGRDPIRWTTGDGMVWSGWDSGLHWNGFVVPLIGATTRRAIVKEWTATRVDPSFVADLANLPEDRGIVDLAPLGLSAWTISPDDCQRCGHAPHDDDPSRCDDCAPAGQDAGACWNVG